MEQPPPPKARLARAVVMPRIFTELEEQSGADDLAKFTPHDSELLTPPLQQGSESLSNESLTFPPTYIPLSTDFNVLHRSSEASSGSPPTQSGAVADFVDQVLTNAAILSEEKEHRLRQALIQVPREPFVYGGDPWSDVQTDTHFGTLSLKPSLVARMLSLLPLKPGDRVLDVSSGVGYTLALLESMGICAFGVEKIPSQAQYSRKLLDKLNLCGAVIRAGEPYRGWSEAGPFDGIIISGPLIKVPRSLFLQLNHDNGFLVCIIVTKRALRLCLYRRIKGRLSCIRLESL